MRCNQYYYGFLFENYLYPLLDVDFEFNLPCGCSSNFMVPRTVPTYLNVFFDRRYDFDVMMKVYDHQMFNRHILYIEYIMSHKKTIKKNKTRKNKRIQGKITGEKEGWKMVHVYGEPYERGYAHGYLLFKELQRIKKILPFLVKYQMEIDYTKFKKANRKIMFPILQKQYPEFWHEIRGIHAGAKHAGTDISMDVLIGWNSYMSLYSHFKEGNQHIHRCSAFIATGEATKNRKIVMAHNVHSDLASGQILNIVLKITPTQGNEFIMQTTAGLISSVADWYISSSGIVCCETTIADINYKPKFGIPFFCRIRHTIQYANSLDECSQIMLHKNAGDYACSWLFGNTKTQEIMLLELGLNIHNIQRTFNGVFYGMNSPISYELRSKETTDTEFNDVNSRCGNRNYRLNDLLNKKYYGAIDSRIAKRVISDHYDIHLGKSVMNQNGICKHPERDPHAKYKPYSCTDGKVLDSSMADNLQFEGIFGSSCGKRTFNVNDYVKQHPEYKHWGEVLENMPIHNWTSIRP